MPLEIGSRRHVRQRIPEDVQVPVDDRVLDDRELRVDLLRLLRPELHLLLLRDTTSRRYPSCGGDCRTRNESSH
jgi:hypothetical protein